MEKYNFTIPAYGKQDVNASGNRIYCESATAPFLLKSGNQTFVLKAKRTYVLKQILNKFLLENETAAPITVEVHIGNDEIIDNEVLISGQISGDVKIVNSDTVGKTVLKVDDDQSQVELAAIKSFSDNTKQNTSAIRDMMEDRFGFKGLGRALYVSVQNASYASVTNATTTIVTGAANVNGVLIKSINLLAINSGQARLLINGNTLKRVGGGGSHATVLEVQNIYIPAGQSVALDCSSTAAYADMAYEVL